MKLSPASKASVALLLGVVALLLGTGFGAANAGKRTPQVRNGGTLTVALAEDPDALDPTLARTFVGRIVFMHICEKLYDLNSNLQIVPQLAASLPTVSPDKLTVTIRLRAGIKFNDGTPLNADAVKTSLDRHRTLARSARASELSPVASVDTAGPRTVVLHLKQPYSPLTAQLADRSGMILSPAQLDKLGTNFGTHPVCVGPFDFVSRTAGDRIVLKKSQFYYGRKSVHLSGLVFKIMTDGVAAAQALRAHDVDVLDRITSTQLRSVSHDKSLRVIKATSIGYQGITINIGNDRGLGKLPYHNTGTDIAKSSILRQAFELAIDRRLLNKVVFGGTVTPGCGPISPSSPWYDPKAVKCNTHRDLKKAKALVKRVLAGTHAAPSVQLMLGGTDAQTLRLGAFLQSQEKDAGINVTVQPMEFVSALNREDAGKFETFAIGWSGRVDPDGNIYQFNHTKGSLNDSGYSNPQLDLILDNARKATTRTARKTLYRAALRILARDRPIVYLYHGVTRDGVSKKVTGVKLYGDGLIRAQLAAFK